MFRASKFELTESRSRDPGPGLSTTMSLSRALGLSRTVNTFEAEVQAVLHLPVQTTFFQDASATVLDSFETSPCGVIGFLQESSEFN